MARPLRIEFENALYHITSRGNERRDIFRTDQDRETFLRFLGMAVRRFGWSLTAWVLMTNHFHLVIRTPQSNLSRGMHWLNSAYVNWFNRTHGRCGHLYQGRFKAFLVDGESYFAEVLRYVVLNPVRAGMCERPEEYRWSSYRASGGLEAAPGWLDVDAIHGLFGPDEASAQSAYRDFVMARIGCEDRLWDKLTNHLYLGGEAWCKEMRKQVESRPRSTDHPRVERAVGRPKMDAIVNAVATAAGESTALILATRGHILRSLVAWLGWHEGLVTLRAIAASLRLRSEGHVSNLIRRCEQAFDENKELLVQHNRALEMLRV
ncbi:MAG: REP-associated tyrosine transposase [Thermoanaerobaculia bacterium]